MDVKSLEHICHACGAVNKVAETHCFACQQPLEQGGREGEEWFVLQERYRVTGLLGSGGFSAVYKALDTENYLEEVAIKRINLKDLTNQEVIDATDTFNREARLLEELQHPQLPRLLDRFQDRENWYLVLEFLPGETLEAYIQGKVGQRGHATVLPIEEIVDVAWQLCQVLGFLHGQEPAIIFRDIKPGNIMRSPTGKLSLIDFGIARQFKPGKSKDTVPLGSPGYAAPEQHGKAQTTARADIYSLGALLHYLLTGNDPAENPFHFPSMQRYGSTEVRVLDELVQRMTALKVEKRPESVQEVMRELQPLRQRQSEVQRIWTPPVGEDPPVGGVGAGQGAGQQQQQQMYWSPQQRQQRQQQQQTSPYPKVSRRLVLGGSIATGIALLLGMSINNFRPTSSSTTGTKETPFVDPQYSWSNDAQWYVQYVRNYGQFHMVDVKSGQAIVYSENSVDYNWQAYWSPDNSMVMLETNKGKKVIISVKTGNMVREIGGFNTPVMYTGTKWSPNQQYIVQHQATNLTLWNMFNNNYSVTDLAEGASSITSIDWSSDSKYIVVLRSMYTEEGKAWKLQIFDIQTFEMVQSSQKQPPAQNTAHEYVGWSPNGTYIAAIQANVLSIFDAHTIQKRVSQHTLMSESNELASAQWSPDSKYIAIGYEREILIWDVARAKVVKKYPLTNTVLQQVLWTPDSQSIIVISQGSKRVTQIRLSYQ